VTIFFETKCVTYFDVREGENVREKEGAYLHADCQSHLFFRIKKSLVCVLVRLYNCIWGVRGLNLSRDTVYPDRCLVVSPLPPN
jgi:hypothetical protein